MTRNKYRLYITLHARSGTSKMPNKEDTYHWGLLIAPKKQSETTLGTRFHAKTVLPKEPQTSSSTSTTRTWAFEEQHCPVTATANALLARVLVAKITDPEIAKEILRNVPIVQGQEDWNCVAWVKDALMALREKENVLGRSELEWEKVRDQVMAFMGRKKEQRRWDGSGEVDVLWPATFDLLVGEETIE